MVSGIILLAFNFRMDIITQFGMLLLAITSFWYTFERMLLQDKKDESERISDLDLFNNTKSIDHSDNF